MLCVCSLGTEQTSWVTNQHGQQKALTAEPPFSCVRQRQRKVRRSWTHQPSSHNSKLGSPIPDPSHMPLLRIAFKYNTPPKRGAHSHRLAHVEPSSLGVLGTPLCWAPPPLTAEPPSSSQRRDPTEHQTRRHRSSSCFEEESSRSFHEGTGASRTGFSRAKEIPALPEVGCGVPWPERQLSGERRLQITQPCLFTPQELQNTKTHALGQHSPASHQQTRHVTAVLIRDFSKFNWKTPPPPSALCPAWTVSRTPVAPAVHRPCRTSHGSWCRGRLWAARGSSPGRGARSARCRARAEQGPQGLRPARRCRGFPPDTGTAQARLAGTGFPSAECSARFSAKPSL